LAISVYPDLSVKVKAPKSKNVVQIKQRVQRRAPWILKQQYFFSIYLPKQPPREYVNGETHYYLGRQYRLKVKTSSEEGVKLRGKYFHVQTKNKKARDRIKSQLEHWYRSHARKIFQERLMGCYDKLRKHEAPLPQIRIRYMSSRWGSCNRNGKIILNMHLIKAPSHCIDYVITHELCHLKHHNHSRAFYNLLNQVMPDWNLRKKRLELVQI